MGVFICIQSVQCLLSVCILVTRKPILLIMAMNKCLYSHLEGKQFLILLPNKLKACLNAAMSPLLLLLESHLALI